MNDRRYTSAPGQGGMSEMERAREKALDIITDAFAQGALSLEEYELRAGAIQKANAFAEIDAQTLDLPPPSLPREPNTSRRADVRASAGRGPAPAPADDYLVEERNGAPEFSLCVMGDRKLTGDWLNSDHATSFTLMGSTTFDLRDTALPPGRLKIDALAIMGEIRIIVPRGLPVKMSAFPFMGEATVHGSVERRITRGMPWVDVSGLALMGSIIVKAV